MDWILPIAGIIAAIAFLILCIGIVAVYLELDLLHRQVFLQHNLSFS
jgi:uncharacterized protein YoxC